MQSLYSYIRSGKLYEAAELCRKAHQPWRAASINGALLFRWNFICMFHFLHSWTLICTVLTLVFLDSFRTR
jgi:hypothetical protein